MQNITVNGRYRIIQQIGMGGFGLTYLAEDLQSAQRPRCVVKHLRPQIADAETSRLASRLFQQEAETLYRLGNHPSIPNLLAHFEERGEFFLVQEFIEGNTIAQEIAYGKRFAPRDVIQFLGQTLEILSFVHAQKVIHRDVKPANLIRRAADGRIFLIDFGAVKLAPSKPRSAASDTFANVAIGSHGYMPVEQMAGMPNFSSDLYALGLIAVEALTGIKPLDLPKNAQTNEFVWAHKVRLDPLVESFITKLVRYDFRQRFFTAQEALGALNTIAAQVGFFSQTPPNVVTVQPLANMSARVPSPAAPPIDIPPTIIVSSNNPPVNRRHRAERASREHNMFDESDAGESANHRNLMRIAVGFLGFAALMMVFYLVDLATRSTSEQPQENGKTIREETKKTPFPGPTAVRASTLDVYREAIEQAEEARAKETGATTKFEWDEIGNKYKRAYLLLGSIDQNHPNYTDAQAKIGFYKQKSEAAFQKSKTALDGPVLNENSNVQTVTVIESSTAPSAPNAGNTNEPKPRAKLTMPAKPSARSYLAYNIDYGYDLSQTLITSNETLFTSKLEKYDYDKSEAKTVVIEAGGARLKIKPPAMTAKLKPGTYQALQEETGRSLMNHAISLSGFYCSQNADHSFTINSIVYDDLYANVAYLDATFNLSCGNRKLLGRVRYDAR